MEVFFSICMLLCGVGVFLTGMKLMGDGLGKGSNKGIRKLFINISDKPLAAYGLGAGATAIVQSSAATTVMSMGLVNSGIMTVAQASAFVLGARLGTSVTGILVSLSSIKITPLLMALAFVGVCLILFIKNDRAKSIGFVLCGLGVLFAGMEIMKGSIMDNEQLSGFFRHMFSTIDFPLLLIIVGAGFTALIQSSSATAGILITLIGSGTLQVSQAMFVTMGATIGTCVTALLASIGAGTNAKRVAVFNVVTATAGAIVLSCVLWPLRTPIANLLEKIIPQAEWQLSIFGVIYSLLASVMFLPFIKTFDKLVAVMVKDKAEQDDNLKCYFIDNRLLKTPAIAVLQTKQEVCKLAELARENLERAVEALLTGTDSEGKEIEKCEEKIDFITNKVSEFLVTLAGKDLLQEDELLVGSLHHVIDDIERIGDHAIDFFKMMRKMEENEIAFSDDAKAELREMADNVYLMYSAAYEAFQTSGEKTLPRVDELEKRIDAEKKVLASHHVERLNSGNCTIETGTYFYTAISSLERIGDHLENVAYSVKSVRGS